MLNMEELQTVFSSNKFNLKEKWKYYFKNTLRFLFRPFQYLFINFLMQDWCFSIKLLWQINWIILNYLTLCHFFTSCFVIVYLVISKYYLIINNNSKSISRVFHNSYRYFIELYKKYELIKNYNSKISNSKNFRDFYVFY